MRISHYCSIVVHCGRTLELNRFSDWTSCDASSVGKAYHYHGVCQVGKVNKLSGSTGKRSVFPESSQTGVLSDVGEFAHLNWPTSIV
jgi:hypothetical protein